MIDEALKYRIVGAVVLLVLAAIVLPLLLDGANQASLLADTRMPPPPDVPKAEVLLADAPSMVNDIEAEIDAAHLPAEPEEPEQPAPVALAPGAPDAAPVPEARLASLAEAWIVQVAALSTAEAAEKLRVKLAQAGYKAQIAPLGRLFRVTVGPELRKEDALAIRDRIATDARFGKPEGRVARYVP